MGAPRFEDVRGRACSMLDHAHDTLNVDQVLNGASPSSEQREALEEALRLVEAAKASLEKTGR